MTPTDHHNLLREKLWADVYAARMAIPDMMINDASYYASRSLEIFDEKFPAPNPHSEIQNPQSDL